MRGGVRCHLGLSAASASYSGPLDGAVVENAHAEVRTRAAFEGCAGRSDDDAVERSERSGRLDAIGAVWYSTEAGWAVPGAGARVVLLFKVKFAGSKSCGTRIAPGPKCASPVAPSAPQLSLSTRVCPRCCISLGLKWRAQILPSR